MKKYKFIGDANEYGWDERPVRGRIYEGSYKFGEFSNTLEENFKESNADYFEGKLKRADYFAFLTDWEVVDEKEEIVVEGDLQARLDKLEDSVKKLSDLVWTLEKRGK